MSEDNKLRSIHYSDSDVSLKLDRRVIALLSESPMSMRELAGKMGINEKKVYRALTSLHKSKRIIHARDEDGVRRYKTI